MKETIQGNFNVLLLPKNLLYMTMDLEVLSMINN